MSDGKKLKKVVDDLMRDNNVDLKDLIKPVVTRIAGEFVAAGLIAKDVEEQMLVTGVDNFTLATKLVNACKTSLVMYPDTNFPKFIEILEGHGGAMELLAKEMESKFEEARKSGGGTSGGGASGGTSGGGASGGSSGGGQVILDIDQLRDVKKELRKFAKGNWKKLGEALGLGIVLLEDVKADNELKGNEECLSEMLKHWLRMNYKNARSDPPTWSSLADAVEDTGDTTVSDAIRKKYC